MTPKILIGIPTLGAVLSEFMRDVVNLCVTSARGGLAMTLAPIKGHTIDNAHMIMIDMAKQTGCTHLMLLETDQTFPPDALIRLLAHDKDVAAATYLTRSAPHLVLGVDLNGNPPDVTGGALREVECVPFGVCLINLRVFEGLEEPWFREPWHAEQRRYLTDDYDFCRRIRANGFSVWLDGKMSQEVGHIGDQEWKLSEDPEKSLDPWGRPNVLDSAA